MTIYLVTRRTYKRACLNMSIKFIASELKREAEFTKIEAVDVVLALRVG
jgi:hypothetical protein